MVLSFKTLQGRFAVLMLLPVGLLLISAGLIGYYYARNSLLHQWRKTAVLELQQEAHRIDMQLNRPKQIIEMYHQASTAGMGSHHTRKWLLDRLQDIPGVMQLKLQNVDRQAHGSQPTAMHSGSHRMNPDARMPSTRAGGRGVTRITPPRYDSEGDYNTVSLITDMKTRSDQETIRLEVVIRLEDIFAGIEASSPWRGHQAFLLDETGNVVYERNGGAFGKPFYELGKFESRTFEALLHMPYGTLLGAGHPPYRVAGFYRLMEASWTLVMIAPGKQILLPIQRFGFYYLVYGACIVLMILGLIRWTSFQTVDSISRLSRAARKVAHGKYEENLQVKTNDEVGELTRSFNAMISHLKERMRLERVINLAKEVQQNLLPQRPMQFEDLEIVGRSVYCEATGGDYFDYFQFPELGPRRMGVVIGDVAGHGVAAALHMTTVRALLRSRIAQPGTLAQVIADVNWHLCLDTQASGNFMTLFLILIDRDQQSIRWVRAGHDPAMLYKPQSDEFHELKGKGIALGVSCDWPFEEYRFAELSPGEVIVLGTDGLWETDNAEGERFGKARLQEVIRTNHSKPPEELADRIIERVRNFHGPENPQDDITLVVIKRKVAG